MTPDELKDNWRKLDSASPLRSPRLPAEEIDRITSGRITGARERLIGRYRRMATMVPAAGICCLFPLLKVFPLWVFFSFLGFYIVAAAKDWYLWKGIKGIDLNCDGVEEVARKARFYRRRHHQFQIVMIPLAGIIIGMMCMSALEIDRYMLYGILTGLVIGLPAGLIVYLRIMRDYRSMM